MEVFTGNCRYSLYSMLKGTLLSYNSGCQVSERRLWDCASSSLGLLNWLCYCRPVQGEGSARESGLCYIRYRAFDCDPPPRGRVFTAALSGEGDLALDPSLCFSQRTTPHHHHHHPILSLPPLSFTPLLTEVIFCTIVEFSPTPLPLSPHPSAWPSRESLILSALQISTLGCQHLFSASLWHRHPSYQHRHSCI